jgi:hypothetical protein
MLRRKTARQNLNQKLNKKKRKENTKRKDSYFIEKKSLPRHQHGKFKKN